MDLSILELLLISIGGFVAGGLNTLAGYGSIITLAIFMDVMGLPPNVANGTNRVNILTNGLGAGTGFVRGGKFGIVKDNYKIIIMLLIGAFAGIYLALNVSNEEFKVIYKYLLVTMLFLILVNPKRWLISEGNIVKMPFWKEFIIFFPIGFYGGFIQMGMGVFFIAACVLLKKMTIVNSNVVKIFGVMAYTIVALAIFHFNGLVDWKAGLLLGASATVGGYTTATFATNNPNADKWAYRILIIVIIIVMLRTFGVVDYVMNMI